MAKVMFRIEIEVPAPFSVANLREDLKDAVRDIVDNYESYTDKKLAKPKVSRLKNVKVVTPDKHYYE